MKALIIGFGSIGRRHARMLQQLGCQVSIVSRRNIEYPETYSNVSEAIKSEQPQYVVVCNETSEHYRTLLELVELNYSGMVMVEKPLFHMPLKLPTHSFKALFVAYNLRFHPMIQELHHRVKNENIISVQAYVGQYLPLWRKDSDYRTGYSAQKSMGGGALRDLSHELDYLNWILGEWESVVALGGHYSNLEITSDDVFALMLKTGNCPLATVQVNYVDRIVQREVVINTQNHTLKADFIRGYLQVDDIKTNYQVERDDTYRFMHKAVLSNDHSVLCSFREGWSVMQMINAAEKSTNEKVWVENEKTLYDLC